uniref:Uncharacterized protein n=1 Tax=Utricularia reniformis TaxID=192314 RepID=A0A1Y0B2T3_9LAMI|nr:hypothetical protein AEK19_MT1468 [Utricularia reniformis]ART31659.1 hypothetical protein AEK19_MT1468 [Utricularia reniformis]
MLPSLTAEKERDQIEIKADQIPRTHSTIVAILNDKKILSPV